MTAHTKNFTEEQDALRSLNPVAAIAYLFVLASAVAAFLR
jgi:hypothetical protein